MRRIDSYLSDQLHARPAIQKSEITKRLMLHEMMKTLHIVSTRVAILKASKGALEGQSTETLSCLKGQIEVALEKVTLERLKRQSAKPPVV